MFAKMLCGVFIRKKVKKKLVSEQTKLYKSP